MKPEKQRQIADMSRSRDDMIETEHEKGPDCNLKEKMMTVELQITNGRRSRGLKLQYQLVDIPESRLRS